MKKVPSTAFKHPIHFLAIGLGSGAAPKAPGTWGTLAAIPFYLLLCQLSIEWYLALVLLAGIAGIYICGKTSKDWGVHDHGGIVWDEFVGFWITMIAVPVTWYWVVWGFVLFRFFDILKPWPIKWFDQQVHGGLGIMVDDVIAGIFAALCLHGTIFLVSGL